MLRAVDSRDEATELVTKHRNIEFGLSTEEVMPRTPASQRSPAAKTFLLLSI